MLLPCSTNRLRPASATCSLGLLGAMVACSPSVHWPLCVGGGGPGATRSWGREYAALFKARPPASDFTSTPCSISSFTTSAPGMPGFICGSGFAWQWLYMWLASAGCGCGWLWLWLAFWLWLWLAGYGSELLPKRFLFLARVDWQLVHLSPLRISTRRWLCSIACETQPQWSVDKL